MRRLSTTAAALALAAALGLAAAPVRGAAADPEPPPGYVDGPTARALVAAGARVVDVRTPQEFAEGHVPGAVNIPHDEIARRAGEIGPPSTRVVLYCRSGKRSAIAAGTLAGLGYDKVYDLGSFSAWPRDGAAEPPKGPTGP
jgi:rhodanese-related sulfurtransferase